MRKLNFLVLFALPFFSSCIVLGGASAGALVAAEVLADTPHIAHMRTDVEIIWPATVENLTEMGATDISIQNYPRIIEAKIYEGEVYIKVEAYDIDHTVIKLQFRKNRFIDNSAAQHVLSELITRFNFGDN
ncbi:MAG: hypothetical protein ACI87A_003779 [Planctomycetota bacterium]|jgi:hypothetical protein